MPLIGLIVLDLLSLGNRLFTIRHDLRMSWLSMYGCFTWVCVVCLFEMFWLWF